MPKDIGESLVPCTLLLQKQKRLKVNGVQFIVYVGTDCLISDVKSPVSVTYLRWHTFKGIVESKR